MLTGILLGLLILVIGIALGISIGLGWIRVAVSYAVGRVLF